MTDELTIQEHYAALQDARKLLFHEMLELQTRFCWTSGQRARRDERLLLLERAHEAVSYECRQTYLEMNGRQRLVDRIMGGDARA